MFFVPYVDAWCTIYAKHERNILTSGDANKGNNMMQSGTHSNNLLFMFR